MDFGDQIALAARLVDDQPEVGELERARFKVVLLDEYQDTSVAQATMLSRLFSGPDADHGLGHPVMAVGDPNQAIYGWRGASVSNILNFADTFPAADGEPGRLPLTVNRRSDRRILDVANRLAEPLLAAYGDKVARLARRRRSRGTGHVETHVFERGRRRARLAGRRGPARRTTPARRGPTSACSAATTPRPRRSTTPSPSAGIPVEIVGPLRPDPAARGGRGRRDAAPCCTTSPPTRRCSPCSPARAGRSARATCGCSPCGRREIAGVRGRKEAATVADQLLQIADGIDASELPALSDAVEAPGEAAYSPEALDRFALLAAELRRLRAHVGDPLLDVVRRIIDTTGVDVELASATSPAAAARRDNLDLFVKAVRRTPRGRRPSRARRARPGFRAATCPGPGPGRPPVAEPLITPGAIAALRAAGRVAPDLPHQSGQRLRRRHDGAHLRAARAREGRRPLLARPGPRLPAARARVGGDRRRAGAPARTTPT